MKKGIDYIGVGTGAIIFNKDGTLFLAKRGKDARNETHKWDLCRYRNGKPRILEPHKCEEIGWFRLDMIPAKDLTIASRKSLISLKKHLSAD
jgi:hypothetical protein